MAGLVVSRAVGCRKRAARRLGRSVDAIDTYCGGHRSNPVHRLVELLRAVDYPELIIAHVEVVGMRECAELKQMDAGQLEAELSKILREQEPIADARAKMAAMAYDAALPASKRREARNALRESLVVEAALQKRAAACIDLLEAKEA